MTHAIIKTENYLLVVDESEIKEGDLCLADFIASDYYGVVAYNGAFDKRYYKKITFHLPLKNAHTLEGVPLLPPLEDDEYDFAEIFYNICKATIEHFDDWVEVKEYNKYKAKEKYKSEIQYTEGDLRDAYNLGLDTSSKLSPNKTYDTLIQSLQQPKYPVAFECEIDNILSYNADDGINALVNPNFGKPKTITNSQGLTQLVGKYIY
jgi:hypothetical protein